jgi:hypothetical protein
MANSKFGEACVRVIMDASSASIRTLFFFSVKCLHSVPLPVRAQHLQPLMWRSLLSTAQVRGGGPPAAGSSMEVVCGVDCVFVVDVALVASVGLDCGKAGLFLVGCESGSVDKAAAGAVGLSTSLPGEEGGLLGGVSSVEAIVVVMLVSFVGVLKA